MKSESQIRLVAKHSETEPAKVLSSDASSASAESNVRLLRSKSKFCDHGLLPSYCAHCKFGTIIRC